MRDEMLGRMWTAHHDQFSADAGRGLAKARGLIAGVPMPLKAMAAVLAMSVTSLLFAAPGLA